MAQIIHIHPTIDPPPAPACIPADLLDTPQRRQSWCYWNACQRARRHNIMALTCLRDIMTARPTERLAGAAGGTLASLGYGYLIDGYGASA